MSTQPYPTHNLKTNGFAIAGLVLSILGLLFGIIPFLGMLSYPVIFLGFIFGTVGLVMALRKTHGGKVMSIVAIALAVLSLIITTAVQGTIFSAVDEASRDTTTSAPVTEEATPTPTSEPTPAPTPSTEETVVEEPVEEETPESSVSYEFEAALQSAQSYVEMSGFSEKSLKTQLEFEEHPKDAIAYAMENVNVDYNQEAIETLESYKEMGGMSKSELKTQLEFEGFTKSQVESAMKSMN